MNNIQNALEMYQRIMGYKYRLIISYKKVAYDFELTFDEKDFRHMAGLHYLVDIDIPNSPRILFQKIKSGKINDEYLSTSVNYTKVQESYTNVKNRIYGLKYLEQFLDNKNLICKYVKYMNLYSSINADYLIKSVVNQIIAYIFLKKRTKGNSYCVCSFFIQPENEYKGISVYWLYKSKIKLSDDTEKILYNRLSKNS